MMQVSLGGRRGAGAGWQSAGPGLRSALDAPVKAGQPTGQEQQPARHPPQCSSESFRKVFQWKEILSASNKLILISNRSSKTKCSLSFSKSCFVDLE